jgi:hypothetical protein
MKARLLQHSSNSTPARTVPASGQVTSQNQIRWRRLPARHLRRVALQVRDQEAVSAN